MKIFINNFMDYITKLYKNKVDLLTEQIKNLENQLKLISEVNAWSPPSGGPAIPENEGGNIELENRMRNIRKPKGDQTDEYKAMEAELNRRRGISSTPTTTTPVSQKQDESLKGVPSIERDSTTPDWVERWAKKWGDDPGKIEAMRRGVIDTLSGDATKPINPSLTAAQVGQRGQEAYDKAKAYVVNLQQQTANKTTQTPQTTTPNVSGTPLSDKFNLPQYRSTEKSLREPSVEPKPTVKPGNVPNAAPAQRESGLVDPDQQRGQFPIYPEGQTDSSYEDMPKGAYSPKPYWAPKTASATNVKYDDTNMNPEVERQKRRGGNAVSDTQNALINAAVQNLSNTGKNAMNFMKTSLMQTQPMQGRYPEAGANFGEQEKTPTRAPSNTTYTPAPYDPNVVHDIDIQDRGPINISSRNRPSAMDLLNLTRFTKQAKFSRNPNR
jgi:hypothetical protein